MDLNTYIKENEKKLLVLVGFSEEELNSNDNKLLDLPVKNGIDDYILDTGKKATPEIVTQFLTLNKCSWITYEEFYIFKDLIKSLISENSIKIVINNKFINLYPFNNCISNIEAFYNNLFSNDNLEHKADEIEEKVSEIYTIIKNVNNSYYVGINTSLFDEYEQENILENTKEISEIESISENTFDYYLEYNDNPENLIKLIQYLDNHKNKNIILTLPSEIENHFKMLANFYTDNNFIFYNPKVNKKIIPRETDYLKILKEHWGHDNFRDLDIYTDTHSKETVKISQAQIIDEIVEQMQISNEKRTPKDIFITSSTGAGKSIMFQIPSLYMNNKNKKNKKVTIVISPLIGLMNDQVQGLNSKNIHTAKTINSGLSPIEKSAIARDVKNGKIDILYVSIETLISRNDIQSLIGDREIGLFVVDEAHTVTTWGRTFRVDYWFMGSYLNKLRKDYNFPIVTFTATAIIGGPEDMYTDIKKSLNLISPIRYLGKIKKDNIYLNIKQIDEKYKKDNGNDAKQIKDKLLIAKIEKNIKQNKKMLVYFPTVVSINQFKTTLEAFQPHLYEKTAIYHGQLTNDNKNINFNEFKNGEKPIILATKAFGMGIDIPDIEDVYHYAISGNVLDYVQEIGRAARKEGLTGKANLDYISNKDFNDFKKLRALSSIKKGQLLSMIEKIKTIYKNSGNKRYLTVNINSFDYIFNNSMDDTDDIENKVKLALLTIENDFKAKMNYPPFVTRPGSINSRDYILVNEHDEQVFNSKDNRKYFNKLYYLENSNYKWIYEFQSEEYWKDHFQNISFPQFKFKLGQTGDEIKRNPMIQKLKFALNYNVTFNGNIDENNITQLLRTKIKRIEDSLREFASKQIYFSENEFAKSLINSNVVDKKESNRIASVILNTLIQINSLLGLRDIEVATNEKYKISNNYEDLLEKLEVTLAQLINDTPKVINNNSVAYFIFKQSNSEKIEYINLLLGFLESFDLLNFEMNGGSTPTINLRINSISQLEKALNNPNKYQNKLLNSQYKNFVRSIEMFKYLFNLPKEGNDNKERIINYTERFWTVIEDYFFGSVPIKVESKVESELFREK